MIWKTKQKILFKALEDLSGCPIKDILSDSRRLELVRARAVIIYYLRTEERMSLQAIGDILGRDHSTINSSIHKIKTDKFLMTQFNNYKEKIYELI
jgi:chromosomal replication initiation ATPase DnaA